VLLNRVGSNVQVMIPQACLDSKPVNRVIVIETAEKRCRILTDGVWAYAPDIKIPQD
jgi:hypothetical protein